MKTSTVVASGLLAALLCSGACAPAAAATRPGRQAAQEQAPLAAAGIDASHAHAIARELKLVAHTPLPPAAAARLERGKPLPANLGKKQPPKAMLARLPQHPGYAWRMAGMDLLLVKQGNHRVADILDGVFR